MKKIKPPVFLTGIKPFINKNFGAVKGHVIMEDALRNYRRLCVENADEPREMRMHTRKRIYPAIAVFQALLFRGISRKQAADIIGEYYSFRSSKAALVIKALLLIPGLYRAIPGIFDIMTSRLFGPAAGFVSKKYAAPRGELRFDMLVCPYFELCKKYGCPEIVPAFCRADDICYGNMHPKIFWGRTKTLGMGGDRCDFWIKKV